MEVHTLYLSAISDYELEQTDIYVYLRSVPIHRPESSPVFFESIYVN